MAEYALEFEIVDVRLFGAQKAIDLIWRDRNGNALREDEEFEIPDQVNVEIGATDQQMLDAIEAKRQTLYQALQTNGAPGIVIGDPELPPTTLVGRKG